MKAKLPEYISFRDVPFALVFAVVWAVALWVAEYSEGEGVWVVAIAYVAFRAARLIINALALFTLGRLRGIALRKADELGVEIPEEPSPAAATIARAAAGVFLLAMLLAIVGMSVAATVPIVSAVGLPPLAAGFGVFGWTAFGVGAFVLAAFFGVPFALFKWTEKVAANMRRLAVWINAISNILSARPLKALGFAPNPNAAASR